MEIRTDDEILTKLRKLENDPADFFGFQSGDLIEYLPFNAAKPFLKDDVTADVWGDPKARDEDSLKAAMLEYMSFAWGKANSCRGISAGRSINHMQVWLWMLGEDEASKEIEGYELYGKPQLRAICERFGWDWRQWDNGEWVNNEEDEPRAIPETGIVLSFKTAA